MIDEWIANGGKFGTTKKTKRGPRRDKVSTVAPKKAAAKGNTSGTKRSRNGKAKAKAQPKLTKEEKKKELKLLELKRRELELELMGSGTDDDDDIEEDQPQKKKGAVETACEEVQKTMNADDSDEETVDVLNKD